MIKNKHKLIILSLLICFVLSLSFVSANENVDDTTLSANGNQSTLQTIEVNALQQSTEREVLTATDDGSFTALNAKINDASVVEGSIVYLENDYAYNELVDSDLLKKGVIFYKNITIDGQGHTINGSGVARIFGVGSIYSGEEIVHRAVGDVTLRNINFVNAFSSEGTHTSAFGAVEFIGSGAIEYCNFSFNNANVAAALAWGYGTDCTIKNCYFTNNAATNAGGGAIRLRSKMNKLTISDSYFINNTAPSQGAAFHAGGGSTQNDEISIINCDFINNNATNNGGGAVLMQCPNGIIKDSRFINNNASGNNAFGGAIYWDGNYANVINSNFTNNTATSGGAIYFKGASSTVELSRFINNTATDGGAIRWVNTTDGTIRHSTFNGNNATGGNGGALYLENITNGNVYNTTFNNGRAINGGGMYVTGTFCDVTYTNFTNDVASYGGAIYLEVGAHIDHCLFDGENATVDGGAIYLNTINANAMAALAGYVGRLGVFNSTLSNCNAGRDGGAGYVRVSYGVVRNTTFINNFAGHDGGAGYVYGSNGNLIGSRFIGNKAVNAGGAVMWIGSNGTANHTNFTANHAVGPNGNGGSIVWQGVNGTIYDCLFNISTAKKSGGAVYIAGNNTKIIYSDFQRYNATSGGAIFVEGEKVNITDASFVYGEARYGGAIYVDGNETRIIDVNLTRNHATTDGGVIYVEGNDAKIIRTNITFSYSEHSGGAVYINGNDTFIKDTNFTYTNASSANGGAIYVNGDDANITNSKFSLNYAINGGAIYIEGSGTHVTISDFSQNGVNPNQIASTGDTKGGSIYIAGDGAVIEKSNFTQSNAGNGGILYIAGNYTNITKSRFKFAIAVLNGGAVYVGGKNASITASTFQYTNATNGGAIYLAGNETNIDANFSYCFAKNGNGGAIYVLGDNNNITNANFTITNAIGGNGGAIYAGGVNTTLTNCHSNIANAIQTRPGTGNGGAVYISGDEAKIIKSVFNFYNATGTGGALYVQGNNMNISHSSFEYGESNLGGAIYINGNKTHMEHSNLTHNHANTNGGIIYINGHNATITDSNLKYSYALASGGAIFINGMENTIKNSNLTYNNASTGFGGSIYINGNYNNITECNFSSMNSHISGGAIYITGANATVSYSNFTKTVAYSGDGGAIYISGLNTTVDHSIFEDISIDDGDGGAIYIEGNRAKVDYCNFTRISSPNNKGGAVCVAGNNSEILNSNMTNCSAFTNGGALYIIGHNATVNVDFENCEATGYIHYKSLDYYVPSYGGAIYIEGDDNNITGSSFKNCTVHYKTSEAISSGGAIYISGKRNTIEYSTFTQDVSEDSIGADIYVKGDNNNITHSTFDNSKASSGGSIYVEGHKVYIHNSTFEICRAPGDGGAIYLSGDNGTIDNCTLKETYSNSNGGAIYISGHNDTVSNSHFKRNDQRGTVVVQYGGAIYLEGNLGKVINSTFNHTGAIKDGGAIYIAGNNATIDNSNFTNSSANYGGVIYVAGDNATLNKLLCENSNSTKDGGALYIFGEHCELHNSTFKNNTALDDGGAINWEGDFGTIYNITCEDNKGISGGTSHSKGGTISLTANDMSVNKTKITNSFVSYNGGAMFVTGNNVNITESEFKNCRVNTTLNADGDDLPYGGALYILGNSTNVLDCTFDDCRAQEGGIIFVQGNDVTINNATCTNSNTTSNGGAFYILGENAIISNSHVTDSNATVSGGAIYITGENANITGSSFNLTNAFGHETDGGGAIFVEGNYAVISSSNFTETYANYNNRAIGGAIYVEGHGVNITKSNFNRTGANLYGGAIYIDGENTTVKGSNFTNCSVDNGYGGAIYIKGYKTTVETSNFENNNASVSGGAIYVNGLLTNIIDSNFTYNYATTGGGAIYLINCHNTTINGSTFKNNNATEGLGGAVRFDINTLYCVIDSSNFENNHASNDGGAVYWGESNYGRILNSNFTNNSASSTSAAPGGNGGAVYWSNAIGGYINNSRFIDNFVVYKSGVTNTFKAQGGAIFWTGNHGLIENSYFRGNNASSGQDRRGGGAIGLAKEMGDLLARNTVINNCTFEENYSPHGGAICSELCQNTTIKNSHFNNNTAGTGGAIYIENARNVTIINTTFDGNHAREGGAYYGNQFYNYNITMDRCNFTNNSAQYGGAIKIKRVFGLEITNARFENNLANDSDRNVGGGAMSINEVQNDQPSVMKLINITFINCTTKSSGNGYGGALQLRTNASILENINFTDCYAVYGGSIALYGCINTSFKNININGSEATSGGSIYMEGGNIAFANATIYDSYAKSNGGSIYVHGSNSNIYNIVIRKTESKGNGGSVYVEGSNTNIHHINITDSMSSGAGGSISWGGYNGTLNFANINNSHSNGGGGAVYWTGGSGKLYNTTINSNIYANDGGSIYWTGNYGTVFNVTVNDTRSSGYGGAIYWQGNNGNLTKIFINNSESAKSAGAIYFKNSASNTVLNNVEIVNSIAKGTSNYARGGGGIYIDCTSSLTMNNVKMNNVSAQWGGALYILGNNANTGSNNNFTNFTISLSKATEFGGAVYIADDNKNEGVAANNVLVNFTITNASAKDGGAVYIKASNANNCKDNKLLNSTIADCTATNYGGAVYWKASEGMIDNLTCINNTAKYGGAIYADTYSLTINNSNFTLNKAERGSAIYTNVALSITNTSFIKNRANSASLDIEVNSANTQVTITFKGWDNLLNAIYVTSTSTPIAVGNVTYWDYAGTANTGTDSLTATTTSSMVEAGQNITIGIYDLENNQLYYGNEILTDVNGQIVINVGTTGSSQRRMSASKFGDILRATNNQINVFAFLTNEDYYTYIEQVYGTKSASHINADADNIDYHQNTTINVSMVEPATGIVSIYINDTFYDNITLDSEYKGGLINVSSLKWGKFLPAGEYEVLAKYWGDDNYLPSRTTATFIVDKLPTNITFDVEDKGYNLYINLTVFNDDILDVTGNVTLEIDGRTFTVDINNSKGFIIVDNIAPGNYTINAAYNGDSNYLNSTNSTDFTMLHKDPASIILNVSDIMINETESINVTVNVNGTGNVTIYVNGKPYNVTLNESRAQLNVTNLPKGTNYVLVIYDGDKNLTGGRVEDTFLVSKYLPTININMTNITYGKTEKLNITLPDDAEGIIKVTINGTKYYGEIEGGNVIINVTGLKVGVYNVTVYFYEDGKYLSGTNTTLFNVSKVTPDIKIDVDNVTYGNHTIINVILPSDATGTVTLKINDTYKVLEDVELVNGTYCWDAGVLPSENYTVEVTYSGDTNYNGNVNSTDFEVYPPAHVVNPTPMTIYVHDIYVGDTITIVVSVPAGASGNITLEINGINKTEIIDANGNATFTLSDLIYGNKTVYANYIGDANYAANHTTDQFKVLKRNSQLNVTATGNTVGSNATITVQVQNNATGHVTVNVNGTNYTIELNSTGGGSVQIKGLGNGTYYVHATYLGDNQYKSSYNDTETFVMSKLNTTMIISVEDIDYGQKANITVTITSGATGYITIRINETRNVTLPIVEGKVNWIVDGLAADNYTVWANYSGDAKYNVNNTDKVNRSFEVRQVTPVITIDVGDVEIDKTAVVTIYINSTATGHLTGTIDGVPFDKEISDGKIVVTTEKLTNKTYAIAVSYAGDKNYTETSATGSFDVPKISSYEINITAGDIKVGNYTDIIVKVPADAQGNVIIDLNGTNYTVTIKQGVANLTNISTLKEGIYNVTAYFGNGKYANKTVETRFIVSKYETPITVSVNPIKVGDEAVITVTAPKGIANNVTIEIDGVKYNKSIDADGKAVFKVQINSNGTRTVVASYAGDDKYIANSTTGKFDVTKRTSQLNVTATGNTVGSNATITVQVQSNATGYVNVNVNGTNYTINLTSGEGSVQIKGLGNGTYYVHATYLGDNQYRSSYNDTETFVMSKLNTTMIISVEDIDYGQKANITVTITSGATGYITIRINETRNVTLPIVEGKVNWIVDGLAADNYTVWANYSGDAKYNVNNTDKVNRSFEVRQVTPVITIDVGDVEIDKTAVVTIYINSTATGHLTGTIDGVPFDKEISDGKIVVTTEKLTNKTYAIAVSYAGDKNYTEASATGSFDVPKASDYKLNITAGDIKVGDLTDIIVNVPKDAEGKVIVNIDGTNYTATIKEGKAVFNNQTGLGEGRYNITAYFGDAKYANKTATDVFYITKIETPISIDVNDSYVGDTVKVVVTVPKGVSENVTVEINGRELTNTTVNGNATFYIKDLAYGNKTVTATYIGDVKYVANSTTANFTVDKRKSTVNITIGATVVGNDTIINVTIPANATGYVIVAVDGTNYTVNTTNGNGTLIIKDLKSGLHKVNVTYSGDEQYFSSINNDTFNINRISSDVSVKAENITVGDKAIINITVPKDATGNVTTVIVNGDTYYVPVANGTGILVVPGLAVGNYTVQVTYNGDDKYLPSTQNETKFSVNKVNVTEADIKVIDQGNGTVVVVVPGNATGNVTIKVGNNTYNGTVVNGTATITLTNETPGEHNITVIYSGDDTHTNATVNATVSISKITPTIKVDVGDIYVGDVALINVTLPGNATGTVTIEINGKVYQPAEFANGVARFEVDDLAFGNKTVAVKYSGDDNYTAVNTTANFTVKKRDSQVNVTANASVVGKDAIINVTVPEDAKGYVIVNVDGTNYTINMTTYNGSISISGLGNGTHKVNVTYIGDDKYLSSANGTSFTINKVTSDVSVHVDNITVGDKAIVEISVPKDATGDVTTVIVNGETYYVPVANGTGILVVPGLAVGNYTVQVTYNGDGKYFASAQNETRFSVNKVNVTEGDIKVIDQGNGTVVVVVPGNATGNVTIKVGNDTYNATVINGTAIVNLTNATPGEHNITVIYSGDGNHTNITTNATVTIPKYETPISASALDIKVGDVAVVTINLPQNATGRVTIEIDGKSYNTTEINNGVATIRVPGLIYGNKTVAVKYSGDANYTTNSTTANFTVDKCKSTVKAAIEPIDVGGVAQISVKVPANATGYVIVEINNETYAIKVNKGEGSAQIKGLTSGTYPINVTYIGDEQYYASNNTASVIVSRLPSNVSVHVDNVTVGDKAIVEISVPKDATGDVTTVIVNGETYYVPVANGTGILVVPGLAVGNYTVQVTYNGDGKYFASAQNETRFSVNKVNVTGEDIKVIDQGNGTVVVVVPGNATGNVTIKVGDNIYNGTVVNGTATITLTNETPGEHNITVIYSGDDTHTNATVNATVTIPKYDTPISVNITDIKEGEVAVITVEVPKNATGNVTVTIDGKEYPGVIVNGTAVVRVENLTVGNKTVVVEYPGDGNYTSNYTVGNFTVGKVKVTPEIVVVDQGNGTVVVVVPGNATGNVTINVGNQSFTGNITNGTAVITLDNLVPGENNVTVIYSGDDNYNATAINATINGPKYDTPISVNVTEVKEGETATVTVTVPGNATGNVTVTVDGNEYPGVIVNGTAVVYVDNLTAGDKTVVVEYPGDGNYSSNYTVGNFTVEKAKVTPDLTVVDLGNGTVVVVVGPNATGNVTISLEGQNYTANVTNGTAVINLDNVTPGTYDVDVIYSGDDNYNGTTKETTITITQKEPTKHDTPINVDVRNINVGDNATIIVTVPENATGNITIEIDGIPQSQEITNGKATFTVDGLSAGIKTVSVIYNGDGNYTNNATTAQFEVSKVKSFVNATIEDRKVGENVTITVNVPNDATGQVLIDIDGVGYYVNVTGGVGTAQIPRIPSGIYDVNLTYVGDDKYMPSSNVSSFNVNKVKSFVIPVAHDIYVGELETIRVIVPVDATGNVTLIIDGEEYNFNLDTGLLSAAYSEGDKYSVAVSGGNGVLVISGLPKGEYTVSARYNGDAKYLPATNTTDFIVSKVKTDMDVIDQGNGTVVVILPDNATGNVTIKLGNDTYTAVVENGTAIVNLNNATPGEHNITVIYSGDDNYSSKTVNSTVDIPKYVTPISVEAHDIYVGETEKVTVTVPKDATGIVIIEINGKEYNSTIENGMAIFDVEGLAHGNKTVAVKYYGDDKYVENSTTGQFIVSKVPSTVNATARDIKFGKDEVITAVVPKDATGRVLVDIDGVGYYGTIINGVAKIIIPNLPAGNYDAFVTYEGDDKYLPSNNTVKFKVTKANTPISATGDEINVGENATVVVTLPEDATGTVTIVVDGRRFTSDVINGEAVFIVPGLKEGTYLVRVFYSGDDNYDANETVTYIIVHDDGKGNSTNGFTDGVILSSYPTGNPILALLVIIVAVGFVQLRRFKK